MRQHGTSDIIVADQAALLIDRGADVNAREMTHLTPLWIAEMQGHTETAALLRERGGVK